jgi:pimeloyl-ACP methyl ester carboxylesterase
VQAIKAEEDLLGEEGLRRIGSAWGRSLERLKQEGIDLDGYTIPETIGDMEAVRQALKHERVNLLSESYGTRVAYLYGLAHPEHLARSVMVGANPPGRFWWDDRKVEEQIADYARLWARDTVMARESTDLRATMRNVLNTLPRKWLFFTIDPAKVRLATFPLLFHRRTAAMVFDAYVAAERGDYSGLALMSLATDYVIPSMFVWGDLASKAMSADFDSTRQYGTEKPDGDRVLGSPLNVLLWGPLNYGHLPIRLIPAEFRRTKQSDVETLVLSGNIDFSTPAEYAAAELIPLLSRGRQVILSEYGHVGDIRNIHPEAAARIIVSYYNTGIADTSKAEYVPMDFRVDWGFPEFAKAALSGIVIIGAALLAGIIWWIRAVW